MHSYKFYVNRSHSESLKVEPCELTSDWSVKKREICECNLKI